MKNRISLAAALALIASPALALIERHPSRCVDISIPKDAIESRGGKWIEVTKEERLFLSGVYAMNPETPAGLPYGDKVFLAKIPGGAGGLIFFIDGSKACTPMPVPKELLDMLRDVATGEINHEGGGL